MKTNPVKQKLRAGQATFGTWLSLGEVHSARGLARCRFEWLLTLSASRGMSWKGISCPGVVN
jgi:4-hydroxy-2-oxoheptanedioate aldolase